jgi:hypothetical protein
MGKLLIIVGVVVVAWLVIAQLARPSEDPRDAFLSVQQSLIARTIGSELNFVDVYGQKREDVALVTPTVARIESVYRERRPGATQMPYQAVVHHLPGSDIYRMECFRLKSEIAEGMPACW